MADAVQDTLPLVSAPQEDHETTEQIRESVEEVWYLKEVSFRPTPESEPRKCKIITQNMNG